MSNAIHPILHFIPQTQVLLYKIDCTIKIREKLMSMGIEENILVTILQGSKKNALVIIKRHNRRIMLRCNKNLNIFAKQK